MNDKDIPKPVGCPGAVEPYSIPKSLEQRLKSVEYKVNAIDNDLADCKDELQTTNQELIDIQTRLERLENPILYVKKTGKQDVKTDEAFDTQAAKVILGYDAHKWRKRYNAKYWKQQGFMDSVEVDIAWRVSMLELVVLRLDETVDRISELNAKLQQDMFGKMDGDNNDKT